MVKTTPATTKWLILPREKSRSRFFARLHAKGCCDGAAGDLQRAELVGFVLIVVRASCWVGHCSASMSGRLSDRGSQRPTCTVLHPVKRA